ncbi:MAG: EVE domain-containing protein [Zhaonellaceae bacterium]|nr:EVE domain-containing protein [Clostridia bacterium]
MYYLFIINDLSLGDRFFSGKEIADQLLANNHWVFTPTTPNIKKLNPKDKVIVYIAGKGNRYFYANFEITGEVKEHALKPSGELEEVLYNIFPLSCQIKVLKIWDKPIDIASVKEDLKFITDKKNYGLFFRQSTKLIGEDDYNLIVNKG